MVILLIEWLCELFALLFILAFIAVSSHDVPVPPEVEELAKFIFDYEDKQVLDRALAGLNNSVIRKYGFAFKANDSWLDVVDKASKLDKPNKFLASIKNKLK